jgi:hypothetical protein
VLILLFKETGSVAPYTLEEGLKRMIEREFLKENQANGFLTGDEQ